MIKNIKQKLENGHKILALRLFCCLHAMVWEAKNTKRLRCTTGVDFTNISFSFHPSQWGQECDESKGLLSK